jgi:hypothetical protein
VSIHRIRLCFGTVRCTCGQEAAFNVWDTDGDELEDMAWTDAGFDELGNCPSCQRFASCGGVGGQGDAGPQGADGGDF